MHTTLPKLHISTVHIQFINSMNRFFSIAYIFHHTVEVTSPNNRGHTVHCGPQFMGVDMKNRDGYHQNFVLRYITNFFHNIMIISRYFRTLTFSIILC